MGQKIVITFCTPKGATHTLETTKDKLPVVKKNAKKFGLRIVEVK